MKKKKRTRDANANVAEMRVGEMRNGIMKTGVNTFRDYSLHLKLKEKKNANKTNER